MGVFGSSRTVPYAEAARASEDGVAIYFRPGCPFCLALHTRLLGYVDRASWVNIWEDDDARAFVRSVNDGNETVPTVVIDGVAHTNPSPGLVRTALASRG